MRIVMVSMLLLFTSVMGSAQMKKFSDQPFAIGIGYVGGYQSVDTDVINSYVKSFLGKELGSGYYAQGVSGFLYIGVVPFLRIGGMSFSGSTSESNDYRPSDGASHVETREVEYNYSLSGLTVEYTLPWVRDIAVSVGALLGRGSISLNRFAYSGNYEWDNIWGAESYPGAYLGALESRLEQDFWIVAPMVAVDIPLHRLVSLRIGGNYTIGIGDDWTLANGQELNGVPDGISNNSLNLQAGIHLGFFSF